MISNYYTIRESIVAKAERRIGFPGLDLRSVASRETPGERRDGAGERCGDPSEFRDRSP